MRLANPIATVRCAPHHMIMPLRGILPAMELSVKHGRQAYRSTTCILGRNQRNRVWKPAWAKC